MKFCHGQTRTKTTKIFKSFWCRASWRLPHLNLLVFYWVLWLYYFWVKRSLRNPREKKKRFSSCNSMGVIPDEPEFFSSLLKLQLTCRDHGFIWFSSNYSSEIYFITNCTWRYMEAISNLIGPLGMIKSVNLNWATYSPGIKDKKQQAVRENWWKGKGKGRKGWGWWEWWREGEEGSASYFNMSPGIIWKN